MTVFDDGMGPMLAPPSVVRPGGPQPVCAHFRSTSTEYPRQRYYYYDSNPRPGLQAIWVGDQTGWGQFEYGRDGQASASTELEAK